MTDIYHLQATVYLFNAITLLVLYWLLWKNIHIDWVKRIYLPTTVLIALWALFSAFQALATDKGTWLLANALVYTVTPLLSDGLFYVGYNMYSAEKQGFESGRPSMDDIVPMMGPVAISILITSYVWIVTLLGIENNMWFHSIEPGTTGYGMWHENHAILWYLHIAKSVIELMYLFVVHSYIFLKGSNITLRKWAWSNLILTFPTGTSTLILYVIVTGLSGAGIVIDPSTIGYSLFMLGSLFVAYRFNLYREGESRWGPRVYNIREGRMYRVIFPFGEEPDTMQETVRLIENMVFLGYRVNIFSTSFSAVKSLMNSRNVTIIEIPRDRNKMVEVTSTIVRLISSGDRKDIVVLYLSDEWKKSDMEMLIKTLMSPIILTTPENIEPTVFYIIDRDVYLKFKDTVEMENIILRSETLYGHSEKKKLSVREYFYEIEALENTITELYRARAELKARKREEISLIESGIRIIDEVTAIVEDTLQEETLRKAREKGTMEDADEIVNHTLRLRALRDILEEIVKTMYPAKKRGEEVFRIKDELMASGLFRQEDLRNVDEKLLVKGNRELLGKSFDRLKEVLSRMMGEESSQETVVKVSKKVLEVNMTIHNSPMPDEMRKQLSKPFSFELSSYDSEDITMGSGLYLAIKYMEMAGFGIEYNGGEPVKLVMTFPLAGQKGHTSP